MHKLWLQDSVELINNNNNTNIYKLFYAKTNKLNGS